MHVVVKEERGPAGAGQAHRRCRRVRAEEGQNQQTTSVGKRLNGTPRRARMKFNAFTCLGGMLMRYGSISQHGLVLWVRWYFEGLQPDKTSHSLIWVHITRRLIGCLVCR